MTAPDITREGGYDRMIRVLLEACPLRGQREVMGYVEARGILGDAEAVGLGALPPANGLGALLGVLFHALDSGGDAGTVLPALRSAGLVREAVSEFAWPDHRLLIPWRGRTGRIDSLQRRVIAAPSNPKIPKYVFPASPFRPRAPFGAELFDQGSHAPVILTEGALEVLARRQLARRWGERCQILGLPSASTLFSPESWTPYLMGRDVVLAFDADSAGQAAAEKFARDMCASAKSVTRERLEGAKDFGEAVLAKEIAR